MSQILLSLLRLADLVVSVTRALASGMRVNEILNTHTTMQDPGTAELAVNDAAEAAKFEHVTFTYKDAGAPSLTDITFTARPGETIGVIGGTGSGKSTLIDLVCRFYDADNGGVALFGHDVKQYSFAQLRSLVGIVPQQAVLFTGTIRDNMQWPPQMPPMRKSGRRLKSHRPQILSAASPACWMPLWKRPDATFPAGSASG